MKRLFRFMTAFCFVCISMLGISLINCATPQIQESRPHRQIERSIKADIDKNIQKSYPTVLTVSGLDPLSLNFSIQGSSIVLQCTKGKPILALTAWHVVKSLAEVPVSTIIIGSGIDKSMYLVHVKKSNPLVDLALLEGNETLKTDCPSATLAEYEPAIGSTVWAIGTPTGIERNVTRGVISSYGHVLTLYYYRTDTSLFYGNSGGGAFNSDGELIGVSRAIEMYSIFNNKKDRYINTIIPGGSQLISLKTIRVFLQGIF